MLNSIVDGITIKLNNIFGDDYRYYDEKIKQGFEEPCFFVKALTVINTPLLGKRKKRTYPFDIAYFPTDGKKEMMQVSEQILDGIEYITLTDGNVLRATSLESEIIDDVLHVSATYSVFMNDATKDDSMGTFATSIGTKG